MSDSNENPNADLPEAEPIKLETAPQGDSEELAKARQQINDYKLLIADFENARRRLTQDAERQRKYAHEPLVKDLLAALDNLDRAIEAAQKAGDTGPLVQGVVATSHMILDVLKRHGVHKMTVAAGSVFDPNLHQAVAQQPTNDYEPGQVTQVLQHGFTLHDRVIRPASVVVASEPPAGGSND